MLDPDGRPVPEPDLLKWAMWFGHSHQSRILQQDHIGDAFVSTVFLGLDHSFSEGPPVLWETMIFGGEHSDWMRRYTSGDDAIAGHMEAVEMVKASQADLQELERMALAGGWKKK
jgi:hypothetical protein